MPISKDQMKTLLSLVAATRPDDMDCDGCLDRVAEYAELELGSLEIPAALQAVERHLEQCPCCEDEYRMLLDGLRALM